jgi:lysophospholipase L1-like esterase
MPAHSNRPFLFAILLLLLMSRPVAAQQEAPPFATDIEAFKKMDSMARPSSGRVLFVGSSSFTRWETLAAAFPKHKVLNRAFGGSSLVDVIRYANDVIYQYKPKQVVIYCGENDIAGPDSASGRVVFDRFRQLYTGIKKKLPGVSVVYVSMKPSPSRWHMRHKMMEGNRLIKAYLATQRGAKFVSVWNAMLGTNGFPIQGLYVEDDLHMNDKGYAIWKKILEPYLLK